MSTTNIFEPNGLTISSPGFALLRKELIENVGAQKAKKLLMRFGYQLGMTKAEQLKKQKDIQLLTNALPAIHTALKHVTKAEMLPNTSTEDHPFDAAGSWHDSIEVMMQLSAHGAATECSCYTLCGFTSGYLTSLHNTELYAYEETCEAKGDPCCTFKVRTRTACEEFNIESPLYDHTIAVEEIPITYDQLYAHKVIWEQVSTFQNKLTEAILQQKDLQNILQIAYNALHIPIYLTNNHGQTMYSCGASDEQLTILGQQRTYFQKITKESSAHFESLHLLTAPIYVAEEMYATVSFVYNEQLPREEHALFLDRFAMVASLYFLNDKIRFETTERLKISFLDRLINQQFLNDDEMLRHSQYIKPTLKAPYFVMSIEAQTTAQHDKSIDLYSQIFQLTHLLRFYGINGLVSLKDHYLIILIYQITDEAVLQQHMTKIFKELQKSNSGIQFKAGISNSFDSLQCFELHMKQAEQAMHFPRQQLVTHYSELGLLGAIIGQVDNQTLKSIAANELGELLSKEDKNQELLYTLYVYLKNNGRLEKTMHDLSLSIGGIKYRIHKIEKIIRKDLKDALVTSYILLLMESLLTLNEIRFN